MGSVAKHPSLRRGLHVHLGPRDAAAVAKARSLIPSGFHLLYVHPGAPLPCRVDACSCVQLSAAPKALAEAVRELGLDDGSSVVSSSSFGLELQFKEAFAALRREAASALSSVRCARAGGLLFLRAALWNLPSIVSSGSWAPVKPMAGFNAVVCGAGPSLEASLPLLAEIQGRVAVIAVGRACRTLLQAGITPDLVCEIDSVAHVNWPCGLALDAPLLAPASLSPDVAALFQRVLWTAQGGAPGLLLSESGVELPSVAMERSVGVYALSAALDLFKFDEAALLGFDLCFGASGSSHAGQGASDDGDASSLCEIPGRDGGLVKSNSLFNGMREAFEAQAVRRSGRVFNCSSGGASIAGASSAELRSFALRRPPFPYKGVFASLATAKGGASSLPGVFGELAERRLSGSSRLEASLRSFLAAHALSLAKESPSPFDVEAFAARLLNELSFDFASLVEGRSRTPEAHCLFERSLRPFALETLAKTHRELAELLSSGFQPSSRRRWRISPNFMAPPFVELELPDGSFFRLSSRLSLEPVAAAEVERFLEESSFDPAKDAALFIAPGNWIHPIELGKRLPESRMLIVEPWPELLSHIASRCQLFHRLPADALVVGACEELPGWEAVLRRRVSRLKAEGFALKAFVHPRTSLLPEARAIAELLSSL